MTKNNQEVKRNWFFIILLTISSLSLAGTAAYFSIFGLAKLFYGAGIGIVILASVLEFSKLVAVSYVYRYWTVIAKAFRAYYVFGVVFIMLLTSIGIYGFLTSAYQKSANKIEIRDSQIKIAENKRTLFVNQLDRINKTIESDNNRINNLSGIRSQQERRLDTLYNRRQTSNARRTETSIAGADEQIKFLNTDITEKMKQASSVNDSIAYYDQRIVEYKASDVSSEVGPLKYLSDLTGMAMNKVVNILVLLIIFVFDPMAISLLIGVNQLTMMDKGDSPLKDERIKLPKLPFFRKKKEEPEEEMVPEEKPEEIVKPGPEPVRRTPSFIRLEKEEDNEIEEIEETEEEQDTKKNEYSLEDCQDGYSEKKIELDKSNIIEGLKVYHNSFGKGVITKFNLEKSRVVIRFDEFGIKELDPDYANLSELRCVKDDKIEAVKYLDFFEDDPDIQDIIIKRPVVEIEPVGEPIEEQIVEEHLPVEQTIEEPVNIIEEIIEEPVVEKKTKFFQKIWRGKRMI